MKKKILILTTYPIKHPKHGGQKRTAAIFEAYKKHFGQVRHSAVFFRNFYADYDPDDIALSPESERLVMQSPLTGDIISGWAIFNDTVVKAKMTSLLKTFKPDIIHIEQPYSYLGLKPLLEELGLKSKLVFGSQNVEAPMKREILEGAGVPEPAIQRAELAIANVEQELSVRSDLVIACTKSDMKAHAALGAKNLVLAPNGIAKSTASPAAKLYWNNKFAASGITQTVLFVGSAHPPNWAGFLQMVGKGLGFVPYNARIVAAGSISDYFEREIQSDAQTIEDATFWLRAFSAGRLSEDRLVALIEQSDVMLLPITEGGGSNLKTAEAILADKKVVTTDHALRSFEWFKDFPNVWVANTQAAFQQAVVEALAAPQQKRSSQQQTMAKRVEWQNCLADMVAKVDSL
jgi:plasmid maintenance system antidote protein VapI